MNKLENLEKLQKLKTDGIITEEEFQKEKEQILNKKSKKNKIIIFICILVILCVIAGILYFCVMNRKNDNTDSKQATAETTENNEDGFKQASANVEVNNTEKTSFINMNSDDKNYSEIQSEILKYFDNDYFNFWVKDLQRYPQVFNDAKVKTTALIMKVIKSDDNEFEVIALDFGGLAYEDASFYLDTYKNEDLKDLSTEDENRLVIIKGSQLSERMLKGDFIYVEGRCKGTSNYDIDGKSYVLSTINSINVIQKDYENKFSLNTVKKVAEYIFGKDIKISNPVENQDYKKSNENGNFYKVTLDNQANSNFKVFNMYRDIGNITYNKIHNELSNNTVKKLFVGADFKHYIVSTYDADLKHVYIDYFDNDFKKLWSREFDYNSTKTYSSPMDYTADKLSVVVDNDLYIIDLATGNNIVEPILVGEKIKVNMMSDGIVLIGDNNKDAIMKVSYDGKTEFKINANTSMSKIETAYTQIVNGKMVIGLRGLGEDAGCEKYIVLNSDGTVEKATEDIETL